MLEQGVISPVTGPASWCSGIIVVPKPNVAVRTDIDPAHLNKAVQREVYPVSSAEDSSAALVNSKIFSKLDAKSGFWQTPLSKESRLLTTFVTPFGRLCMNRLPFGICSASELFRRTVSEILADVEAVICHTDDILSHAADQTTRDSIGRQVLRKLSDAGLSLSEKGECSKEAITFLVHIIDGNFQMLDCPSVKKVSAQRKPSRSWSTSQMETESAQNQRRLPPSLTSRHPPPSQSSSDTSA